MSIMLQYIEDIVLQLSSPEDITRGDNQIEARESEKQKRTQQTRVS